MQVRAVHALRPDVFVFGSCVDPALNGSYVCTYAPTIVGIYNLSVTLNRPGGGQIQASDHVSGSPFSVNVTHGALSPRNCLAVGAGIAVSAGLINYCM